jgi:hypothetical protein
VRWERDIENKQAEHRIAYHIGRRCRASLLGRQIASVRERVGNIRGGTVLERVALLHVRHTQARRQSLGGRRREGGSWDEDAQRQDGSESFHRGKLHQQSSIVCSRSSSVSENATKFEIVLTLQGVGDVVQFDRRSSAKLSSD